MFDRWYAGPLQEKLARPYVHLVFGARQAGKSTLLRSLLPPGTVIVDLADPKERTRHLVQYLGEGRLYHLRTKDGAEVDFIIERAGTLTPIEVKWSEKPTARDARHLLTFLAEHPNQAQHGYVICRCSRPQRIHDQITALPWFCL